MSSYENVPLVFQDIDEKYDDFLKHNTLSYKELIWFNNALGEGDEYREDYQLEKNLEDMMEDLRKTSPPDYEDIFVSMSELRIDESYSYDSEDFGADEVEIDMDRWLFDPNE